MDLSSEIFNLVRNIVGLPEKDRNFIIELLEHDEWGVAFESICGAILEDKIPISNEIFGKVCELGKKMDLDSSTWECLHNLINKNV